MKLLVFSNPQPGREDEYNDWYDNVHLQDILAIPGVIRAERLRILPDGGAEEATPTAPRYLAIYEFEGGYDSLREELGARAADGRMLMNDALDRESLLLRAWEEI